jgi:hypothetical protein
MDESCLHCLSCNFQRLNVPERRRVPSRSVWLSCFAGLLGIGAATAFPQTLFSLGVASAAYFVRRKNRSNIERGSGDERDSSVIADAVCDIRMGKA